MNQNDQENAPRPRLLFVEGSRLMRRSIDRILGQEFRVLTVETVEESWAILVEDPLIQVVFYDLDSESTEGQLGLLERIRQSADRRVKDTPVVLVTDDDMGDPERQQALERGFSDFIDKPFRPSELLARARAHATASEARQRLGLLQKHQNKDEETGLGNRRYFFERLAQALSFARRHRQALSLVHIHLDGLRQFLQNLSDDERPKRLRAIGAAFERGIRHEDTVYRSATESFSFILPGTDADGAETVRCRMIPELAPLGLFIRDSELAIEPRFVVQEPAVNPDESLVDALRRIRETMGSHLPAVKPPPVHEAAEPEPALKLELELEPVEEVVTATTDAAQSTADLATLIAKAKAGDIDTLQRELPQLLDQLKPLLELAEQLKQSDSGPNA